MKPDQRPRAGARQGRRRARAARAVRGAAVAWGSCFRTPRSSTRSRVGENVAFPLRRHTDWPDAKIREVAQVEAGRRRPRRRLRQDAGGSLGRHEEARRAGARDGARPGHPAGRRAERRPRSDHRRTRSTSCSSDLKKKGTTLVVVTHNIPSARHIGDELAMLHEGRVIARARRRSWIAATTSWFARSCGPKGQGRPMMSSKVGRRRRVRRRSARCCSRRRSS